MSKALSVDVASLTEDQCMAKIDEFYKSIDDELERYRARGVPIPPEVAKQIRLSIRNRHLRESWGQDPLTDEDRRVRECIRGFGKDIPDSDEVFWDVLQFAYPDFWRNAHRIHIGEWKRSRKELAEAKAMLARDKELFDELARQNVDSSPWRPARDFPRDMPLTFPTPKALTVFLSHHPEIHTRRPKSKKGRPDPHRLEVHAADVHKTLADLAESRWKSGDNPIAAV